jgi:hypothetical protein
MLANTRFGSTTNRRIRLPVSEVKEATRLQNARKMGCVPHLESAREISGASSRALLCWSDVGEHESLHTGKPRRWTRVRIWNGWRRRLAGTARELSGDLRRPWEMAVEPGHAGTAVVLVFSPDHHISAATIVFRPGKDLGNAFSILNPVLEAVTTLVPWVRPIHGGGLLLAERSRIDTCNGELLCVHVHTPSVSREGPLANYLYWLMPR